MKNEKCHAQQSALCPRVIESIRKLVDYVYDDEQRSFEEADGPEHHIFHDILILEAWLAIKK